MAELEGYFQLLDLADWDYAINLSAEDFPLMSTEAIHKKLEVIILKILKLFRRIPEKAIYSIGKRNTRHFKDSHTCYFHQKIKEPY